MNGAAPGARMQGGDRLDRVRSARTPRIEAAWGAVLGLASLGFLAAGLARPPLPPHLSGAHTSSQCVDCHRMEAVLSHPVGVAPTMLLPPHLPLENGRLACLTCHDAAAARPHTTRHGTAAPGLLRRGPAGFVRCADCHDSQAASPGAHAALPSRAHAAPSDAAPAVGAGVFDERSSACLACHDGAIARDAAAHRSGPGFRPEQDYPVGIVYRTRPARGLHEAPLHPPPDLDPRVRLFDGAVGCESCHSLYSRLPARLVMSNHDSRLCLTCHAY